MGSGLDADTVHGVDGSHFVRGQGHQYRHTPKHRIHSGFFETSVAKTSTGWPRNGTWWHLISQTHGNTANYYAMQFAANFYDTKDVFFRCTSGNGNARWERLWHAGNLTNVSQLNNNVPYVRSTVGDFSIDQDVSTDNVPQWQGIKVNRSSVSDNASISIKGNSSNQHICMERSHDSRRSHWGHDASGPYIRALDSRDDFSLRAPSNLRVVRLYFDGADIASHSYEDRSRNPHSLVLNGTRIIWRDKAGSSQTDEYYLEKTNTGDGSNELRLHLQDNHNEYLRIYGYGNRARHTFRSNGDYTNTANIWTGGDLYPRTGGHHAGYLGTPGHSGWFGISHYAMRGHATSVGYALMQNASGETRINGYNGAIYFRYRNSNRMALHANGNLVIGNTTHDSGNRLDVYGSAYIRGTGHFSGDVIAYYSDRRLKKKLEPITDYKVILAGLTGYRYEWGSKAVGVVPDDLIAGTHVGLIAQDVEEVLPQAVHTWAENDYKTIKYDKLVPVLVEALKSEIAKSEDLEERLARLERLVEELT
jgi:hypothetical protein